MESTVELGDGVLVVVAGGRLRAVGPEVPLPLMFTYRAVLEPVSLPRSKLRRYSSYKLWAC